MHQENSVIYGLEFQARSLASQLGETNKIKFLVGTQSLKRSNNQIHLVEFNEETLRIKSSIFQHSAGELWKITTNPLDASRFSTCYSLLDTNNATFKSSIYNIPDISNPDDIQKLESVIDLPTETYGSKTKTTEFHPIDSTKIASVIDHKVVIWDLAVNGKCVSNINFSNKRSQRFTTGKWNPHQNAHQFTAVLQDRVRTYDLRSGSLAWQINRVHHHFIRDLDYNMNKQYHLVTCGDDGYIRIWDYRQPNKSVFSRREHSHWIWCVRFNHFHDQLILSASSDSRVLVSNASSVCSESNLDLAFTRGSETRQMVADGPLQWCEHEDSVYCADWSPADPWVFASLSYDGRLVISKIERSLKYQIML